MFVGLSFYYWQTVENQRFEIKRFCKENNLQVDKWIA